MVGRPISLLSSITRRTTLLSFSTPTTTSSTTRITPSAFEQTRSISFSAIKNLLPTRRRRSNDSSDEAERSSNVTSDGTNETALKSSTPKGLFESLALDEQVVESVKKARGLEKKATFHKSSTANFKTSKRKLNDLSRLIAGRGADEAILQLKLSPKKQAPRLLSMVALARDHAVAKGLRRDQLVIAQSWTSKGPSLKRLDIKGRGRHGVKHHPSSKLHVLLAEGLTEEEKRREKMRDQWRMSIRGLTEDSVGVGKSRPVVNVGVGGWRW